MAAQVSSSDVNRFTMATALLEAISVISGNWLHCRGHPVETVIKGDNVVYVHMGSSIGRSYINLLVGLCLFAIKDIIRTVALIWS